MKKTLYVRSLIVVLFAVSLIRCSEDENETPSKSTEKTILSFKITSLNPEVTGTINEAEKKITLVVTSGTPLTSLVPSIEISEKATISPVSGSAQNFTSPVTYTVTAEDGTTQNYVVSVTKEVLCLPTELPGEESNFLITYNDNNTIDHIDYVPFDYVDPEKYSSKFEYKDGKLTRINHLKDGELESFTSFEYPANKIIEKEHYKNSSSVIELSIYRIYYIENDQIIAWSLYDDTDVKLDSVKFTYTNSNVTHIDGYNSNDEKVYTYDFEYDDKINPYKLAGINEGDNGLFSPSNLSVNNAIKEKYTYLSPADEEIDEISYTYDAEGKPLTKKASWDDDIARTISYSCK